MKNDTTEIFRERLKKAREDRGMTQAELAEKAGLPPSSISHFEKGPRKPSFDTLRRLAKELKTTTDYLLGRTAEVDAEVKASVLFRKAAELGTDEWKVIEGMIDALTKNKK